MMAAPAPSRRSAVPSFYVMEVMRAAAALEKEGRDVLHMEVGQPSTGAPAVALAAASAAVARSAAGADTLGYTCEAGVPPLRAAVAAMYARRHALAVPLDRCFVTTGSSAAFVLTFLAAFDAGDRVAVASPGYPCYTSTLEALGVVPVPLAVDARSNFQPTAAMLDAAVARGGPLRGLIVASPSNPCGTMLSPAELFALRDWCRRNGCWLVSDEIYHRLCYGELRDATALEPSSRADEAAAADALAQPPAALGPEADHVIVINSLSKWYSMTGWRIGWCVVPPALLPGVSALAQNLYISPPTISQHAAAAALGEDCEAELQGHLRRYAANRALLLRELPRAGFTRLAPSHGAFYLYADVAHLTADSRQLAARILAATGVALTPGVDFDRERGRATLRFSYCGSEATVAEAARRLVEDQSWRDDPPQQ